MVLNFHQGVRLGGDEEKKRKADEEKKRKADTKEKKAAQEKREREQEQREQDQREQEEREQEEDSNVYYENCDAVRAAGAAPIYTGDPGYSRKLDRDGDGVACESWPTSTSKARDRTTQVSWPSTSAGAPAPVWRLMSTRRVPQ